METNSFKEVTNNNHINHINDINKEKLEQKNKLNENVKYNFTFYINHLNNKYFILFKEYMNQHLWINVENNLLRDIPCFSCKSLEIFVAIGMKHIDNSFSLF